MTKLETRESEGNPNFEIRIRVLCAALIASAIGVAVAHATGTPRSPTVRVVVESGFWLRPAGMIVVAEIPAHSPLGRLSKNALGNGKRVQVVAEAGRRPVPCLVRFDTRGRLEKVAFRLAADLAPLSEAHYWVAPRAKAGPVADFAWPETDVNLFRTRNGGFEQGGETPRGWSLFRGRLSTEQPYSGNRCVQLDTNKQDRRGAMLTSEIFTLRPNACYTLRVRARGRKEGRDGWLFSVGLNFLDETKKPVAGKPSRLHFAQRKLGRAWRTFAHSESTPGQTRFGRLNISIYKAQGTLWVDEIELLEPVSARRPPPAVRVD